MSVEEPFQTFTRLLLWSPVARKEGREREEVAVEVLNSLFIFKNEFVSDNPSVLVSDELSGEVSASDFIPSKLSSLCQLCMTVDFILHKIFSLDLKDFISNVFSYFT